MADTHPRTLTAGAQAIVNLHTIHTVADTTASAAARQAADDLIWQGNVEFLRHEQRAVVQPCFDHLSCAFARLALRAPAWPRITRFDDRWRWLVTSVVPRFRRIDADTGLVAASLRRISDEARHLASAPCVLPRSAR